MPKRKQGKTVFYCRPARVNVNAKYSSFASQICDRSCKGDLKSFFRS